MRTANNFGKQSPNGNRANRATERSSQNRYYIKRPRQPYQKDSSIKIVPWYDGVVANLLYLVIFAPVGVWRMYVNKRFTPLTKLTISFVSITWFLIVLINLFVSDGLTKQTIAPTSTPMASYTPVAATETPATTNTPEPDDGNAATPSTTYYIKADGARLRSSPTTDSDVLATFDKGDTVTKVSVDGDWIQVTAADQTGYIRSDLLSEDKP